MNRVEFKFKNGHTKMLNLRQAELLTKAGIGTYATRMMAASPTVAQDVPVVSTVVQDDLESMTKEELHVLAKERGVKVHHNAGAERVREALRG